MKFEWNEEKNQDNGMKETVINEYGEEVVTMDLSDRGPLTDEEQKMIEDMDSVEDIYDDDCPEMPDAMKIQMRLDIAARQRVSGRAGMLSGVRSTADTLSPLRREFPNASFTLIIGADKLLSMPYWRDANTLFSQAGPCGGCRPRIRFPRGRADCRNGRTSRYTARRPA